VNTERATKSSWGFQHGDEIVPGRYAFKPLGGGRRFEAYLAWDDDLHSLVVAKIVRPELASSEKVLGDLAAEAHHLLSLNHPVIVRGFDAVLDGPRPHLLMEYLEGPHLSRLLRRYGSLAPEQLMPLALQLCSALHYLHHRKLVHLDVKPRNIIMGAPPRLIDLSITRTFERAAGLTSPIGTDAYMAPEQCDPSRGTVGPAADIFGLAATLYHAITGNRPYPRPKEFDRDDPMQRFPQLGHDPAPFDKSLPSALEKVVFKRLDPDPGARGTAADLAAELEPFVAALPTRPVLGRKRPRL
jgi:eukaryotic-like serine/threonine-protein kinase